MTTEVDHGPCPVEYHQIKSITDRHLPCSG
jgi:hypothetical protein